MNSSNYITLEKEVHDIEALLQSIKESGWVDNTTVFINCAPLYSSLLSQFANHKLSHLIDNEPFEQLLLELPTSSRSQVFNTEATEYQSFDKYLVQWIGKYIDNESKFLFLSSKAEDVLHKVLSRVRLKTETDNIRFASLYTYEGGFMPDFWVKTIPRTAVFSWENTNKKL